MTIPPRRALVFRLWAEKLAGSYEPTWADVRMLANLRNW